MGMPDDVVQAFADNLRAMRDLKLAKMAFDSKYIRKEDLIHEINANINRLVFNYLESLSDSRCKFHLNNTIMTKEYFEAYDSEDLDYFEMNKDIDLDLQEEKLRSFCDKEIAKFRMYKQFINTKEEFDKYLKEVEDRFECL